MKGNITKIDFDSQAFRKLRQEDYCQFEAGQNDMARVCFKT